MNLSNTTQDKHYNTNLKPSHEQLKQLVISRKNQKQIILKHLVKHGNISTLQAHTKGILAPAARILELRKQGYDIVTIQDYNLNGMATYILNKKKVANDE